MQHKTVDVLLIDQDLRDVLLCREGGQLRPLTLEIEVIAEPDEEQDKATQAIARGVEEVSAVHVPFQRWVCVRPGDHGVSGLHVAVVDLREFEPAMAAHDGWQRVGLQRVKHSARRGEAETSGLAPLFEAVDQSSEACSLQLCAYLEHLSRNVDSEPPYWASNEDHEEAELYCSDCCQNRVDELNVLSPKNPYVVDGGDLEESDVLSHCEGCNKMLDVLPTADGVGRTVDEYVHAGIDLQGPHGACTAKRLHDLMESGHHQFDALKEVLYATVRDGVTRFGHEDLKQISLDAEVACAAKHGVDPKSLNAALEKGGNPNAVDADSGMPALYWACKRSMPEMAAMLVGRGADVNSRVLPRNGYPTGRKDDWMLEVGNMPIHKAIDDNQVLNIVLPHVADVNVPDARGWSVLHRLCVDSACPQDPMRAARQLLDAGADPNQLDNDGATPLKLADRWLPELADLIRGYAAAVVAQKAVDQVDTRHLRPV